MPTETTTTTEAERCERCHGSITDEEHAMGWPIAVATPDGDPTQDVEYVCPGCFGDEAYCAEGHLLRGNVDSSTCDVCVLADAAARGDE